MEPADEMPGPVTYIAHRARSGDEAENSLAALAALPPHVRAVELDVRGAGDGRLLCIHDQDLRRIAGIEHRVADMDSSSLIVDAYERGVELARLEDALQVLGGTAVEHLLLDVKDGDVGSIMVGGGVLLLLYSFAADIFSSDRNGRDRSRSRKGATRAGLVLGVILLLILVPATVGMVIPSGLNEITIVSSQSPSSNPTVIERGGTQTVEYNVTNDGYFPQVAIIEPASTGVTIEETTHWVRRGESAGTVATIHAPDETGVYYRAISERQYLGILPLSMIVALHAIHPWVAILGINLTITVVVTAIFAIAVGFEPLRFRETKRDTSLVDTLRRKVRKWL